MVPHKQWWEEVGPEARIVRYSQIIGQNYLLILDKEILKEILTAPASKNDCRFKKPFTLFPSVIGYGLVTLEGEEWARHRRIIQPAFSVSFLKETLNISVPPKVQTFIRCWLDAGEGQEIDLASHLSALTLDIIGDAGFSYDTSGLKDIEAWSTAVQEAKQAGDKNDAKSLQSPELTDPLIKSFMGFFQPSLLRLVLFMTGTYSLDPYINPKTVNLISAISSTVEGIIQNAKNMNQQEAEDGVLSASSSSLPNISSSKSLLRLLLQARDAEATSNSKNALSDQELKDELKTFLLAGHETTSTWCYWALYAMAKHPDVQDKVFQDVIKNLKDTNNDDSNVTLEEAENMEYLSAFLNEVLRMYPPVGMVVRRNCYEETIAGYKIPKDTNLMLPVLLLHRNPKYWPEPEIFKPERWLGGGDAGSGGMDSRNFTFLPFGAGGHNCIGYKFATYEAKMIVAQMVRAVRVEIAPSQRDVEHTFTNFVTMKAKPGLKIVFKAR
ncbi:methylcoclaurine 3'-hydroxylase isozyme 1 [Seminavis robusta]|uniref:Methylcoclaurine 3'-hydroxylase isozyme 1 n=1 Tax=Seminavis robusta TaxID=568900 RepID=A0A9N8EDA0_9STRA|nr:methylcoclaurine 3'-hydroxylase isozyme 1 [Seminavis robusta]|eukprot:Sro909_g218990.1 methylcoclaurine 3'-hydroxylase isozyme 1 (496) ;mRNA; f:22032-23602